ncbi:MAG TPA: SufD family Fe-S cluster assembly protein [Candidatus Hydrogenedentes bacterium]|nr:MAG: cysteine desulfurase activator complex subunit SufB [Candidatus Hydrogenedentes bacterium ADurb.Bin170]HNZ49507.1 SufD family Fe-S cluster assembly protein [Candidatus Hydrogenedentota bacterium]HOD96532.1 SufD family Fe-S cluster assembly protein [Candidatus Hydrogenedentota bacterium]HOM47970.1 SufD family Fe-S cluster assembly protein [Candidatus Hydrogenedentota bacterium]HOR51901.1 SufD family Fe-S cluster assembly protein [Candidatus Hydrogenedentota bacterium]
MSSSDLVAALLQSIGVDNPHGLSDNTARIEVHENRVVGLKLVPGLKVDADETDDGINVEIRVEAGVRLQKPVHICFGVLPEDGRQHIDLDVRIHQDAHASFLAHCTFPNAVDVRHTMTAGIEVEPGAHYAYFERHVHGTHGGITVIPEARVIVHDDAEFTTEFELIKGRAGQIKFDYETLCHDRSVVEMTARISGRADDRIEIHERAQLLGDEAKAALISHIALRDDARAEIYNDVTAYGARARGHVDCKEIVLDRAIAKAVPMVAVHNPTAHVTHEAAIGSVDSRQLQTLLSRGLTEDEATDLIIEGLLSKKARWTKD